MTAEQIQEKLKNFTGWVHNGHHIEKIFYKSDIMSAVDLINKISVIAESLSHYPELTVKFNKITIRVGDSEIKDVDFQLIKEIEKVVIESM